MENGEQNEPKTLTVIEQIEAIKETQEFKTLVQNQAKQYIGGELKTVYSTLDGVIKETIGAEKPEDVKTSEWLKQNLSKLKDAQTELETLKQGKGKENAEQEKLWNDRVNKLKQENSKLQDEIKNVALKGFKNNVDNQLDTYLVGKTFKPTYSEDDIKTLVAAKKEHIVSNTRKLENGKIAVYNPSTDSYYLDTLGEPLTPAQVAEKLFSSMYHTSKTGGGADADQPAAAMEGDVVAINMNEIKSRKDFYDAFKKIMAPKGLTSLDKEFQKQQKATMAHYKIESLPLS